MDVANGEIFTTARHLLEYKVTKTAAEVRSSHPQVLCCFEEGGGFKDKCSSTSLAVNPSTAMESPKSRLVR